jgi:NADH-quinone oxidoreductase subunit L
MHDPKLLLGIVLFPLVGAIVNGFFGRGAGRQTVHAVAVASVAMSFACAVTMFLELVHLRHADEHASLSYTAYEWFSISVRGHNVGVPVRFVMDALSGVMTLVVTGIGLLIHIYSTGYMSEEKSYARFFAYLNLFTASMLILVLGSSLPLMFVGWEGVGVCSYLLIGFWFETAAYAAAGRKAFVANRIGDFGVLMGMFLLVSVAGTFEFAGINHFARDHASALTSAVSLVGPTGVPYFTLSSISLATLATLFLFLGCTGKSAQLPLFVWLPDAMAGPTPVSALIHAATMVTSGIYLVCRLSPVFVLAPHTMAVIAVTGTLTALLGATVGLVQNDIKKILAYSTVSQLGFMFAAVGCGAFAAGFMHVYTHAFFKACLFLGAGSVMHAVGAHGDADIRTLGGLRKYMPTTRITFLVSCMAIAGVPLFSGFFSKDEILVGALASSEYFTFAPWLGPTIFGALFVGATMTAFYMFRLYFLTFSGEYRGGPHHEDHGTHGAHGGHGAHDEHAHHDPHESPAAMVVPLIVLAIGAFGAGYVWVGLAHFEPWVTWLEPALGSIHVEPSHNLAYIATGFGTTACAVGIFTAYSWYYKGSELPAKLALAWPRLHALLMDKWRVDGLYEHTILAFSRFLGTLSSNFDKFIVDGILTNLTSGFVVLCSGLFTRLQTGLVHTYGAVMAAGTLAVVFFFIMPHPHPSVVGEPAGLSVNFEADKGLAYEYRWDFDGDGKYDTEWQPTAAASHTYRDDELRGGFVALLEGADYGTSTRSHHLMAGEKLELSLSDLGEWQADAKNKQPPTVVADKDGLVVHPNGAIVRKGQALQASNAAVHVGRGEHVSIGGARLSVAGSVRPRLAVRNAFGMERARSMRLSLPLIEDRLHAEVIMPQGAAR